MPCICYGAISGEEAYDDFLKSPKGKEVLEYITKASSIIMAHRLPIETFTTPIEFRQMFVKCFLHMLVGCDEHGKPKANERYQEDILLRKILESTAVQPDYNDPTPIACDNNGKWYSAKELGEIDHD